MSKILLIDDKKDNLTTLSALLKNLMPVCAVITTQSGMEGIEKAKAELPDVILLDVKMPGMDGFETCRQLKSDESTKHIPVIMITAIRTDPQSRGKGLEIGADAFLSKPIDEYELVSQVKVALRIKKAEDALREERDSLERLVEERTAALKDRLKEMALLQSISQIIQEEDSCESIYQKIACAMPIGFYYPEIACARIICEGQSYQTENFSETEWCLSADLKVKSKTAGTVEVFYVEERPAKDEGPFINEERDLINLCAERLERVTERKRAEEALRESENLLSQAQEISHTGSWKLDLTSNRLTWSDEVYRIFGCKPQEFAAAYEVFLDFVHPDDRAAVDEAYSRSQREGSDGYDIEHRIVRRGSGEVRHVHERCVHERDAAGVIVQSIGMVRDITERKQAEERQKEEFNLRNALLDNIPNGMSLILKKDTHEIVASNKAAHEIGAVPGKTCFQTCALRDDPCPFCLAPELWKSGQLQRIEVEYRGTWYEGIWAPLGSDLYVHYIFDITERKQAEAEREKLQTQLNQAQKMESIGTLAGGVAHDFNNILSSVIGYTELALDDVEKGSHLEDNLLEVFTAGKRARDLVKQILTFARQSDEEIKPVQVDIIVKEALKFLRSSVPTTIEIRQNIESDSLIMGDPTQVHQILMNLFTNAGQAMDEKGGVLNVDLTDVRLDADFTKSHENLTPGDYLKISVSDTGPGMAPKIIESIFAPYFTTKAPGEGTGMGLSTVHGIVKQYGGEIMVESEVESGSTFNIYLPITKKRTAAQPYQEEALPSGTERILVVDDELSIAKMSSQILERLGYRVTVRTSSIEALELFRSKSKDFDLVISDMTMPNMTGDKLAAELMNIRSDIPVILCTGYSKKISEETASSSGIKAFAYKPLIKADLAKAVRRLLDEAKGSAQQ